MLPKTEADEPSNFCCRLSCAVIGYAGVVLAMVAIFGSYLVYLLCNLIPQMQTLSNPKHFDPQYVYEGSLPVVIVVTILFHIAFAMLVICFLLACFTPPGYVPSTPEWKVGLRMNAADEKRLQDIFNKRSIAELSPDDRRFVQNLALVERKKENTQLRFCKKYNCHTFKPDRTHHCSVCGRCILRMDHHCPWVHNCIGFMNYKYFVLLLVYATICVFFLLGILLPRAWHALQPFSLGTAYFFRCDFPVLVVYLFLLMFTWPITRFLYDHINMAVAGLTTIEYQEKKGSKLPQTVHRFNVAHLKFSKGSGYQNFCHVFGPWWMWFVPKNPRKLVEGLYLPESFLKKV